MNDNTFTSKIAREQNISDHYVKAVADLLAEGATIPFIARYRKEATGSLDEVAVTAIRDRLNQLRKIEDRKKVIVNSLEKHGHLTVRGAVSIARRLMDPLAELVKIDPKSIGVGQYQHDVDQAALKQAPDDVVMSCVNGVGDRNRRRPCQKPDFAVNEIKRRPFGS